MVMRRRNCGWYLHSLSPAADHGGAEVQILFNPPY